MPSLATLQVATVLDITFETRASAPIRGVRKWAFTRCARGRESVFPRKHWEKNFIRHFVCCNFVFCLYFHHPARRGIPGQEERSHFPERGSNFARPHWQVRIRGLKLCETSRCTTGNPRGIQGDTGPGEGSCSYNHAVLTSSSCKNNVVFLTIDCGALAKSVPSGF
jgi:hypothetical protein